ncbi:chorionic somatomammotropin hormone 2 [Bos mutus]|uniref:chorionic somatomammotropin hormone 2 n=1 Tax=Bos mutus TaxID=72004 RepID=UPI0038B58EFD
MGKKFHRYQHTERDSSTPQAVEPYFYGLLGFHKKHSMHQISSIPSHQADSPRSTGVLTLGSFHNPHGSSSQLPWTPVDLQPCPSRVITAPHVVPVTQMKTESPQDEKYAQGKLYYINATKSCHTNSFHTPEERDKAQQMNNEDLIKWTLVLLYCWNNPLYYLVPEIQSMKNLSEAVVSSAEEIENMSEKLESLIETHFGKIIFPVLKTIHEAHITWSRFSSMTFSDEDRRLSEFYNLFHCLCRDSRKVDMYIKILTCRTHKTC